jgi:hypothetical protein
LLRPSLAVHEKNLASLLIREQNTTVSRSIAFLKFEANCSEPERFALKRANHSTMLFTRKITSDFNFVVHYTTIIHLTATNIHHVIMNTAYQPSNGTRVTNHRHASDGGRAYPKEMREQVIAMYLQGGLDALKTPTIQQLRANQKFPHIDTCKRWIHLYHTEGHVLPKRHTGNAQSEREVNGIDLVNLALFRLVLPTAYIHKCELTSITAIQLIRLTPGLKSIVQKLI